MSNQTCCGCCPLVIDQPCGCPPGSVRSTIAIFATVTILTVLNSLIIILAINQQWSLVGTVANGPTAIISAIISWYFATRNNPQNTPQGQPLPDQENTLIPKHVIEIK